MSSRLTLSSEAMGRIVKAHIEAQIEARKNGPVGSIEAAGVAAAVGAACREMLNVIQDELAEHLNLIEDALDRISALENK